MTSRTIIICFFAFVLSVIILFVFMGVRDHQRANAMWEKCVSDLRAAGQPVTFADIEKLRPTIAPEHNGALMIENMSNLFEKLDEEDTTGILFFDSDLKIDLFNDIHTIDFKPLRILLSSHATILNKLEILVHSRGGRTSLNYDTDLQGYLEIILPNARATRLAGKLLQLQILIALRDGDLDQAIQSLILVTQIATTLDDEPNLIHRLVQMAADDQFVDSLELILRYSRMDDTTTKLLQQTIRNRLKQKSMKSCFQLERVYFLMICNGLISDDLAWSDISPSEKRLHMSETQIRKNQLNGSKIYDKLIQAADEPSSILSVVREVEQKLTSMKSTPSNTYEDHRIIFEIMPSLSRAIELHIRCIARLRCALVALAADQYYQQHKTFPDDLEELVPDYLESIPNDPFDDKPLRSKKTDYGYVIYSVGENLVDDGGDVASTDKKKRGPDVGFRLAKDRSLSNTP